MDSLQATPMSDDLSALAWVYEEVRKSLDTAHKALHRCLKESGTSALSDVDALDPAILRSARQQIHQGVGALELAGLPAGAMLLRASEAAVQRFVARPQSITSAAVQTIESASFALLDLMRRRLAGKPVSALALFPQYESLLALGGGELPRPSDLWVQEWPGVSLEVPVTLPSDVAPREVDEAAVADFEWGLLQLLRGGKPEQALPLVALCSQLAASASARQAHRESATWMLASGFLEAIARQRLPLSVHVKRVLSALLSQLRTLARQPGLPSDRLAHELLFFCAQAEPAPDAAPTAGEDGVLDVLRRAFHLESHRPVDLIQSPLGRFDPAWVTQASKRVVSAKDGWSAVAGGELLRLTGLNEQFSLVGDSLRRLYPDGEGLAQALADAARATVQSGAAPAAPLAMEVATSLLYLEASLDEAEFEHPDERQRVQRLAERIQAVREGRDPEPLEPWMEALYRHVSDRQTIGSVVQELRSALGECEKRIDQFFRDHEHTTPLVDVPSQLQSMKGVLAVLGLDAGAQAVTRMRADVDALLAPGVDFEQAAQTGVHDRLASNLGALGFLVDMLAVQPPLAKNLFVFNDENGVLTPIMGRAPARPAEVDPIEVIARPAQQVERARSQEVAETLVESASREELPLTALTDDLQLLADTPLVQEQPQLAASLATAQAAIDRAAASDDEQTVQEAREEIVAALTDFAQSVSEPVGLEPLPEPAPVAEPVSSPLVPVKPSAPEATGLEEDDEMRDIFIEEAREVIADARAAVDNLREQPDDVTLQTTVRRAFHTLKGSSRMVGLSDFGEAAWGCEQLYNTWLASQAPASDDLLGFTADALEHLSQWVDAIVARDTSGWSPEPLVRAADAMRHDNRREPIVVGEAPVAQAVAEPEAQPQASEQAVADLSLPDTTIELVAEAPAELADTATEPPEFTEIELTVEPDAPAEQPMQVPEAEGVEAEAVEATDTAEFPVDLISLDLSEGDIETVEAAPGFSDTRPGGLDQPEPELAQSEGIDLSLLESGDELLSEPLVPASDEPVQPLVAAEADTGGDTETPELPDVAGEAVVEPAAEPSEAVAPEDAAVDPVVADEEVVDEALDDQVKVIGPLRISIPLFNIYLNEADEQSRRLSVMLSEWALEWHRPVGDEAIALAHSLAGNSGTVGYTDLSRLARLLEHALMKSQALSLGDDATATLFNDAAEEIRRLLHQFAAGFLKAPSEELIARLEQFEVQDRPRAEPRHLRLVHSGEESQAVDIALPDTSEDPAPAHESHESQESQESQTSGDDDSGLSQPMPLGLPEVRSFEALAPIEVGTTIVSAEIDLGEDGDIEAQDAIDADLFPIFEEEALELLPQLSTDVRRWVAHPEQRDLGTACMRTLHTFKGGARLAGAMRLGELAHRMESAIERLMAAPHITQGDVEPLEARADMLSDILQALQQRDLRVQQDLAARPAELVARADTRAAEEGSAAQEASDDATDLAEVNGDTSVAPDTSAQEQQDQQAQDATPVSGQRPAAPAARPLAPIDWSQVHGEFRPGATLSADAGASSAGAMVRVRPRLLDRLVNHAGEVSIARTRLAAQAQQMRSTVGDLTDNLERLRQQLRDIELQAETQVNTRMEAARAAQQEFDPLEFDRYTRFQELTRMMAESVNDVATVQRALIRNLESAEDQLAAQFRLTRDLQDDLLRTRMVEFEGLSDRLYRVVRQAAKETGKQVRLDIVGGQTEVDRGVLDRMGGAFEHLVRNSVTHGIEPPAVRQAAGKDAVGAIIVAVRHEGNEVSIEFRDDGAGLDLGRIRHKAETLGLVQPGAEVSEAELAQMIFTPGFSTADTVTELAGRGIGMDVVRSDVNAMGGRIETATAAGQGTSFRLVLPLTTAVTKVVMVRCGDLVVSIPTNLVELVRRARGEEIDQAYASGVMPYADLSLPFFWFGALLQHSPRGSTEGRSLPVVVVRSAQQRVALHVDEVLGNQDVVVKNLGPQLSRVPGLAGMTLLASGAVALIYNPVALAAVYGTQAQSWARHTSDGDAGAEQAAVMHPAAAPEVAAAPLVLVVDDSLTVRRVTQRLLTREGYRVTLAKDGLEALEKMAEEIPVVVLSDIEMPRMDGFDLVRNLRGDERWRDVPVVMITSRIAQKHREYAAELGVNHYLGKPYSEEELVSLVAQYSRAAVS